MSSRAEDEAAEEQPDEPAEQRAETLRRELDLLLGELRDRGKRAFDLRYQLQKHPAVVAGAGALVLAGVGLVVAQVVRRQRRRHSVRARMAALSSLIQERAVAGISAARTGTITRRKRRRGQEEPGNLGPLVKAAIGIALPRLLPLIIGKLLKGGQARQRTALAATNGRGTPTG